LIVDLVFILFGRGVIRTLRPFIGSAVIQMTPFAPFPSINVSNLSLTQVKILHLLQSEYAKHPAHYDANVMRYTDGNREPWCADFITWIMLQAGVPYKNPNSGGWRIPGVYTVKEYYQSQNRYVPVGNYKPQMGDVAIYDSNQTHDLSNNIHVAIVLVVKDGVMTTIGGNEGGRLNISTRMLKLGENGLIGFGKLKR
jgi:hypothetical protein